MILHNIKITRGTAPNEVIYDFSDDNARTNNVVINFGEFTGELRTEIVNSSVKNGGKLGTSLGSPRLYTLKGQVFGPDRAALANGQEMLRRALVPGSIRLDFTLDDGLPYLAYVQIYKLPSFIQTESDLVLDFEFELVSKDFEYRAGSSTTEVKTDLAAGTLTSFSVDSIGTGYTPLSIDITGSNDLVNPKLRNVTTGNYYKINYTVPAGVTLNLIFNTAGEPLIYLSSGPSVKYYRASGSTSLYVINGTNNFELTADSDMGSTEVTLEYRDLFI